MCDGVKYDGVKCDGMKCDGVKCDGVKCDEYVSWYSVLNPVNVKCTN